MTHKVTQTDLIHAPHTYHTRTTVENLLSLFFLFLFVIARFFYFCIFIFLFFFFFWSSISFLGFFYVFLCFLHLYIFITPFLLLLSTTPFYYYYYYSFLLLLLYSSPFLTELTTTTTTSHTTPVTILLQIHSFHFFFGEGSVIIRTIPTFWFLVMTTPFSLLFRLNFKRDSTRALFLLLLPTPHPQQHIYISN